MLSVTVCPIFSQSFRLASGLPGVPGTGLDTMQNVICSPTTTIVYEPRDPNLHRSRFKSQLGPLYLPLVTACFEWRTSQGIHLLNESTVKAALEHSSFKKILDIHEHFMKIGRTSCVPEFLLELVDQRFPMEFLVAYTYLVGSIPNEYERYHLPFLCQSSELPRVLKSLGAVYTPPVCKLDTC